MSRTGTPPETCAANALVISEAAAYGGVVSLRRAPLVAAGVVLDAVLASGAWEASALSATSGVVSALPSAKWS
jgi:hypothetical protein